MKKLLRLVFMFLVFGLLQFGLTIDNAENMNFFVEIIVCLLRPMTLIIIFWMIISMVLSNFRRNIYHFFDDTNSLAISITLLAILYGIVYIMKILSEVFGV